MTITKNLMHKLLITAFIMIIMTDSHQLNAMEPEKVNVSYEPPMDADFQAYKLLSTLEDNPEYYLPAELVGIIATNVSKLIDKECYEKYDGKCFYISCHLVNFIEKKQHTMSHVSIVTIVKRWLRHSNKLIDKTIFCYIARYKISAECLKIVKLITGNGSWY
ncbi:MAG TPA: hypothetical protein VJ201_03200, partial [Candidatus Babeliales bacterium]|nr:hypothetical protein [Candidatus Babeliales bacterium]